MKITKRLHHRPPYLMIDQVIEHTKNSLTTSKICKLSEGFIQGHFPNAPVVPGAMIQEMCTQSAGLLISEYYAPVDDYDSEKTKGHALGVLRKVSNARYLGITKPEKEIIIKTKLMNQVDNLFEFQSRVFQEDKTVAKLEFQLVNISDSHLTA